jgi:hypothetical protein
MNFEQMRNCEDIYPLLVKRIAGELSAGEKNSVESHLAGCAACMAQEQELTQVWQGLEFLQAPEIPKELFEKSEQTVLAHLKQEQSPIPWLEKIPHTGIGAFLFPVVAGLVMTGVSFFLIHNLANLGIHHHHVLISLFGLWWLLFAASFWVILKGKGKRILSLDLIAARSLSITLLTLFIAFLAYEVDSIRWLATSVIYAVAIVSDSFLGVGNTFITSWWVYCCQASFIGAFIFGFHKAPSSPETMIITPLVISLLVVPAIYVQGSSHNHGYGIIAFAAGGTYIGSLVGISLGGCFRKKIFFQPV